LNALYALDNRMSSKRHLAREAMRIEQDVLKENVGCQDQVWAAYGGFNRIDFSPDGNISVTPIILSSERRTELSKSLMLFFTGFSRVASDFAEDQINNIKNCKSQLKAMRTMVDSAMDILGDSSASMRELGQLLHESWMLKRELAGRVRRQASRRRRRRIHGVSGGA
jgi:D-glycero-alpha-D-manno-heptose-7-phosphate kinase